MIEIKKVNSFRTRRNLLVKLQTAFPYLNTAHYNSTEYLIAVEDHKIVGCIGLCTNDIFYDGLICNLWVADDYRRQGIAKKLLREVVLRNPKVKTYRAYVCEQNDNSRKFFQKYFVHASGFEVNKKLLLQYMSVAEAIINRIGVN